MTASSAESRLDFSWEREGARLLLLDDALTSSGAAIVAQWGGFGAIFVALGWFAWHQTQTLRRQATEHREAITKAESDHRKSVSEIEADHRQELRRLQETLVALQKERILDAQQVTQTLLNLQGQFNETTNAVNEELARNAHALDGVRTLLQAVDRRIEALERRR